MQRFRILADILKIPAYSGLCIAVAGAAGLVLIWFFNWDLVFFLANPLFNDSPTLGQQVALFVHQFITSPRSLLFVIFILLLGLNVMSFTYIERQGEKGKRGRWGRFPLSWLGGSVGVVCGGPFLTLLLYLMLSGAGVTTTAAMYAFLNTGAWIIAVALSGLGLWRVLDFHPDLHLQHVSDERW